MKNVKKSRIYHRRCRVCGRPLTTHDSKLSGIGPDCAKMLGERTAPCLPLAGGGKRAKPAAPDDAGALPGTVFHAIEGE